tara:strand:- start:6694 stop:7608 length:915 start_codon:yes stop_codon:yes gene_type:complete
MKASLLIVGGGGFIGSNLAKKANKRGYKVFVISLNSPKKNLRIKGVKYLKADITDYNYLKNTLHNHSFDYVVNLSGYINHSDFLNGGNETIDVHFDGVRNILRIINWGKIKRFVQIGSSDEYGSLPAPQNEEMNEEPISSYSLAKVATTKMLRMLYRTENFPAVILRLFLVFGPGQNDNRFIPQVIQGCLSGINFPTSVGEQLRDFCYVDDVCNGILLCLTNDNVNGEVINIASGKPIAIHQVIRMIQKNINSGIPEFGQLPYRKVENMNLYADISKSKKILNWTPKVSLEEGVLKTIESYRNI